MSWMDRNYLDDLRDEARDAMEDERRHYRTHHGGCRCDRCLQDRFDEADDDEPRSGWQRL